MVVEARAFAVLAPAGVDPGISWRNRDEVPLFPSQSAKR